MLRLFIAVYLSICPANAEIIDEDHSTLKVLTFNTWLLDIPIVPIADAKHLHQRFEIMADMIAATDADIVSLQEVWREHFRAPLIRRMLEHGYYAAYNYVGRMSNGLLIFSKYRIRGEGQLDTDQPRRITRDLPVITFPEHTRADENPAVVRKGAILAEIEHPILGTIDFYNTHLGAVTYRQDIGERDPTQDEINLQQAAMFVEFVRKTKVKGRPLIAAMDLNTHYRLRKNYKLTDEMTPQYRMMTTDEYVEYTVPLEGREQRSTEVITGLNLIDADSFVRSREVALDYSAVTFDTQDNPYASNGAFEGEPAETIDYVFYSKNSGLKVKDSQILFRSEKDLIPYWTTSDSSNDWDAPQRLSDHYGVMVEFDVKGR